MQYFLSPVRKLFPRAEFEPAVRQHRGERHARRKSDCPGFTAGRRHAVLPARPCPVAARDLRRNLAASQEARHSRRSAALDAGLRQPATPRQIYETVVQRCWRSAAGAARATSSVSKTSLLSLTPASSTWRLAVRLFPAHQRRRQAASGARPDALFAQLRMRRQPTARRPTWRASPDVVRPMARSWSSTAVYNDYDWFAELSERGVFFVTRLKRGADYEVLEQTPVAAPPRRRAPRRSDLLSLAGRQRLRGGVPPHRILRRRQQRTLVFLTVNHLELAAATIAAIYQDRWLRSSCFSRPSSRTCE